MICTKCGIEYRDTYAEGELLDGMCFYCSFWTKLLEDKDLIVIKDNAYSIGDENDNGFFRGLGGSLFYIRIFATGEVIRTTNLWHRGNIPIYFQKDLPSNAEFVRADGSKL